VKAHPSGKHRTDRQHYFISKRNSEFLIIADEVQSGVGRTGKFFGFEHFGLQPDLVTLAKPIGGGLPLGAVLGGPAVADVSSRESWNNLRGNPVACAAGAAMLDELRAKNLMRARTAWESTSRQNS